jgi:hypothetical protein
MQMYDTAVHEHVGQIESDVLGITMYDRFKPGPGPLQDEGEADEEENEEDTWDPTFGVHNRRQGVNRHVYWAGLFRSLQDVRASRARLSQDTRNKCPACSRDDTQADRNMTAGTR